MVARKGVMNLKIVRAFIAFVIVSLFVGIGSAFNGQSYSEDNFNSFHNSVDKTEIGNDISTETVDKETLTEEQSQPADTNNSFSESNEKTTAEKQQSVKKNEIKTTNTNNNNSNSNVNPSENTTQIQENKQDTNESTQSVETKETTNISISSNDDKYNSTYYSITKGIPEYDSESACKSSGLSIQNKDLDSILDWNEEHPDNPKSRTIGSSMCIIVMKEGKEHWFLHFLTISGNNMDEELKRLYK